MRAPSAGARRAEGDGGAGRGREARLSSDKHGGDGIQRFGRPIPGRGTATMADRSTLAADEWKQLPEGATQNCLPSIQAPTSRFACSSEIPERVLTIEQSCPLVLIDEQSKLVRKRHSCCASFM